MGKKGIKFRNERKNICLIVSCREERGFLNSPNSEENDEEDSGGNGSGDDDQLVEGIEQDVSENIKLELGKIEV